MHTDSRRCSAIDPPGLLEDGPSRRPPWMCVCRPEFAMIGTLATQERLFRHEYYRHISAVWVMTIHGPSGQRFIACLTVAKWQRGALSLADNDFNRWALAQITWSLKYVQHLLQCMVGEGACLLEHGAHRSRVARVAWHVCHAIQSHLGLNNGHSNGSMDMSCPFKLCWDSHVEFLWDICNIWGKLCKV